MDKVKKKKVLSLGQETNEISYRQDTGKQSEKTQDKSYRVISLASELGFSIALPIAGGAILGEIIDKRFQTFPKITLSLILVGVVIGFLNMYLVVKGMNE